MAKVKSMNNRNLIGTLGGAVYYMRSGENVAREKAAFVTNPRSTPQMNQRVRLANLVNFYRANRSWMFRGAFENKPAKWSDYNAFVSRNIQTSDVALTKAEANAAAVIVDAYQVTDGSLPQLPLVKNGPSFQIAIPSVTASTATVIKNITSELLENYQGLREGDQISIILMVNKRDANGVPRVEVYPNEFNLSLTDEDDISVYLNFGGRNFTVGCSPDNLNITITANAGEAYGMAVVVSRTTSSGIKVSPSVVVLSDTTFSEGYSSQSQFEKAIDSYGESVSNFLDSSSVVAGQSNTPSGDDDQGGSGSGDPGDVEP